MQLDKWKKANKIYSTLVHLSKDKALDKLEQIGSIDDAIKEIIVSLIDSGEQSSQYFKQHVSSDYAIGNRQFNQWQEGKIIGDYQLIKMIGKGGMSTVFSAKRINSDVQKHVAIKIFASDDQLLILKKKFIEEQKILSGLSHPNIITMHHGETTSQGEPYIVMELIENAVALDDYVKLKGFSKRQKIQLILDVANALVYAHSNLIIHRDIKPSNIILTNNGNVKIVDFGIAKQISKDEINETTIVALTPSFASQEQINAEPITVATDIFSLAATALALLIGKLPLPNDRLFKLCAEDEEYIQRIFKKSDFDKDLKNILNQALKFDPKKRYKSMDKFADDLQAWLNNETVSATPDSIFYRVSLFAKRRKALFASLLTLMFSVTIALIAISWQYNKTKIEAQKAQQVKQFMLDAFNVTDPNVSEGVEISAKDILKIAGDKITGINLDSEIKFELYQTIGIAYGQLGFLQKGIDFLYKSLELKPHNSQSLSVISQYLFNAKKLKNLEKLLVHTNEDSFINNFDKAMIYRVKASVFAEKGDYEQAFGLIEKLDKLITNQSDVIRNKRLLAEIYYLKGESNKSIEIIKSILNKSDLKDTNTLILSVKNDLVHHYDRVGDFDSALALNEEIIAQYRIILGDRHPGLGVALNEQSVFYRFKGELDDAYLFAEESHDIFKNLYGDNSTGLSQAYSNLAVLSFLNNDYLKAAEQFEKAVTILENIYSSDHLETLNAKANLAWFLNETGQAAKAEKLLYYIYRHEVEKLGATHRSPLMTQQTLALTLATLKKFEEAEEQAKANIKQIEKSGKAQQNIYIYAKEILARIYLMEKRYQDSLEVFLSIEGLRKESNRTDLYAALLWKVAKIYVHLNQFDQADIYYQKALPVYASAFSNESLNNLRFQLAYALFLKSQNKINKANKIAVGVRSIYKLTKINDSQLLEMLQELEN